MTEGRKDGKKEGGQEGKLTVADAVTATLDAFQKTVPHWQKLAVLDIFKGAVEGLRHYIETDADKSISWKNPFAQLEYDVALTEEEPPAEEPVYITPEDARALSKDILDRLPDYVEPSIMQALTRDVVIVWEDGVENGRPYNCRIVCPADVEKELGLTDYQDAEGTRWLEREAKLKELAEGFELSDLHATGTVKTDAWAQDFAVRLVFAIRPLFYYPAGVTSYGKPHAEQDRAFYPVQVGLDFTEGDPAAWSEEDRDAIFAHLLKAIDDMAAPYLKERKAEGKPRSKTPKPDRVRAVRPEHFKAPGRLFDTPRHIEAQRQEELLPEIGRWYAPQTAFNRTVGMAAAALTKTKTREDILDWQSATVEEVEDLVFCRSEHGAPAHGQHREDILKAFEALRAIPVPIVWIDWKKVGSDRRPRWIKQYKLRVASLLQSYGAVFVDRATGKKALAGDPGRRKDLKKRKPGRRKRIEKDFPANPADGLLKAFPADKYKLTGFEWRWNTDIAEDFICPQVALDAKDRPRLKLKKGRHIEGSRFIMLNREYFAVQKSLRQTAGNPVYAPRLLDVIVSEKTHITSRGGAAVWIEIEAGKVIKWLGLGTEHAERPKHVEEDHVAPAIAALIAEKVLLPASDTLPRTDPNPDRRKKPYYRWKVAERWTTVALVPEEEAKDIEDALVKEAEAAEAQPEPVAKSKTAQTALPGMEEPPALPIPSGADIRAAREAAGLNLRDFARMMHGPAFKTWSRYERGEAIRVRSIKPEVWQRVRDFIEKHGSKTPENGPEKADLSRNG